MTYNTELITELANALDSGHYIQCFERIRNDVDLPSEPLKHCALGVMWGSCGGR